MEVGGLSFQQWLTLLLALVGVTAMMLSSVGIMRMPDFYTRLHAGSIARTLGISTLLLSVAAYDGTLPVLIKVLFLLALLFLTTPVAAHLLGQAAYLRDIKRVESTHIDDLAGAYHLRNRQDP